MAHLFQSSLVQLLCSCGLLKPITAIYFCRYCLKLRCANCVSHEMDLLYCPSCLENMPLTEARLKKNRCGNCFDCPSCGQSLCTRASSTQTPVPQTAEPAESQGQGQGRKASAVQHRKHYYLLCTGCRWTSRDVGIPDQTVATGGWPEQDPTHLQRIHALLEYYRCVAQREKLDRERRRLASVRSGVGRGLPLLRGREGGVGDKGVGVGNSVVVTSIASVRKSLAAMNTYALQGETPLTSSVPPSLASDDVEGLPDHIFTEPVCLTDVSSLPQRLSAPEQQPEQTSLLYPLRKPLLVKRSLRCRHCEHNLCKPEYNPSSIKFKINLAAAYHVPEVRLVRPVMLKANEETCIELSLCNPTPHPMPLALLPFMPPAVEEGESTTTAPSTTTTTTTTELPSLPPTSGPPSLLSGTPASSSLPRLMEVPSEGPPPAVTVPRLPQGQVVLAGKDDTAEYGDQRENQAAFRDDPQVVVWRRANKVGVNVYVTPEPGDNNGKTIVNIGFVLRYDYTNTVIATNTAAATAAAAAAAGLIPNTGPTSLGISSAGLSVAPGLGSGPNSLTGPTSMGSIGPTAEARTVTLNVPVVIKLGYVIVDPQESHA